jgi:hypothetical protein
MNVGDQVWVAYAICDRDIATVYVATVVFAEGNAVYARCSSGVMHTAGSDSCRAFADEADAWAWCGDRFQRRAAEMLSEAARCESFAVADKTEAA